jgi:hypothetical protein
MNKDILPLPQGEGRGEGMQHQINCGYPQI